jgi:hypothetical protein
VKLSQLQHTIVTECPAISGCCLYTADSQNDAIERQIGTTSAGDDKLIYIKPNQCSPSLPSDFKQPSSPDFLT